MYCVWRTGESRKYIFLFSCIFRSIIRNLEAHSICPTPRKRTTDFDILLLEGLERYLLYILQLNGKLLSMPTGFNVYAATVEHQCLLLNRQQEEIDELKANNNKKDIVIAEEKNARIEMASIIKEQETTIANITATMQNLEMDRTEMASTIEAYEKSVAKMTAVVQGLEKQINEKLLNTGVNDWNACQSRIYDTHYRSYMEFISALSNTESVL